MRDYCDFLGFEEGYNIVMGLILLIAKLRIGMNLDGISHLPMLSDRVWLTL
jgi:hypothetical protein